MDRAEQRLRERMADAGGDAPTFYTTGPAGIGRDLTGASGDSLDNTTIATVILVVVILLIVYRSPLLALVPLVTIAVSVWVALKLLALCTLIPGFYLVNISQIFAVVMLYGAGTDYCLFLISRYREELAQGREPRQGSGAECRLGRRRTGRQRRHGHLWPGPDGHSPSSPRCAAAARPSPSAWPSPWSPR